MGAARGRVSPGHLILLGEGRGCVFFTVKKYCCLFVLNNVDMGD